MDEVLTNYKGTTGENANKDVLRCRSDQGASAVATARIRRSGGQSAGARRSSSYNGAVLGLP